MQISEVIEYLEKIAPLHLQESYDNAGLIIGDPTWQVKGILTTLDVTEEVLEEALDLKCNLILAHHPIIFNGLKQIRKSHHIGRAVIASIKNDLALYAIHTNLDNVLRNGVNEKIGDRLGLLNYQVLSMKDPSTPDIGSGLIGDLPEPMHMLDFIVHLKKTMTLSIIKHTAYKDELVQRIALCGGSGRFLLENAIAQNADVFISSDFKYHDFFEANNQICAIDIGHYESEQYTKDLLQELIQRKFSNFAAYCSKVNTNPINYK